MATTPGPELCETCYKTDDQNVKALELTRMQLLPFDTNAFSSFPDRQDACIAKRSKDMYVMQVCLTAPLESGGQLRLRLTLLPTTGQLNFQGQNHGEAFNEVVVPFYRGLIASRYKFIENALFDKIRMRG
ncbi:hypothetical protein PHMEG_00036527 [Phytophthora megakarya]|uniref:Uncharacterized protein n=1 Tax=Phytophthora megakarya TaxID=4795 RepID=A0A225ULL0_9STRA|nr:hypothetical protein PHMEG_00036527 [Phytophthora megakarya]